MKPVKHPQSHSRHTGTSGPLQPTTLSWRDGVPYAPMYEDAYFQADGVAESAYIYVEGNDLAARFAGCQQFCLVETGFGVGLNCALTLELWRKRAPTGARLQYIAVEKHPVSRVDLMAVIQRYAAAESLRAAWQSIANCWPVPRLGWHLLHPIPGVDLILILDDVVALEELVGPPEGFVDAWFLDGFAPSRNPSMWGQSVFHAMARCARAGSTATSFSAARQLRDGLADAGFVVAKRAGWGRKRDSVRACKPVAKADSMLSGRAGPGPIAVIGAGVAGTSVAHALTARGLDVTLCEASAGPATGTSGNPGALVAPSPQAEPTQLGLWLLQGYDYVLHRAEAVGLPISQGWLTSGPEQIERLRRFAAWAWGQSLEYGAGRASAQEGCWLPMASGSIAHVCRSLLAESQATGHLQVKWNTPVTSADAERWLQQGRYGRIVDTTGTGLRLGGLPLARQVRGQLTKLGLPEGVGSIAPLSGPTYFADGWTGATFDPLAGVSRHWRVDDDIRNRDKLAPWLPELSSAPMWASWVGTRALSPDHMPCIGSLDVAPEREGSSKNRRDRLQDQVLSSYCGQRYAMCATGTRGLVNGLLGAQVLAAWLSGEPLPIPAWVARGVVAGRYLRTVPQPAA